MQTCNCRSECYDLWKMHGKCGSLRGIWRRADDNLSLRVKEMADWKNSHTDGAQPRLFQLRTRKRSRLTTALLGHRRRSKEHSHTCLLYPAATFVFIIIFIIISSRYFYFSRFYTRWCFTVYIAIFVVLIIMIRIVLFSMTLSLSLWLCSSSRYDYYYDSQVNYCCMDPYDCHCYY